MKYAFTYKLVYMRKPLDYCSKGFLMFIQEIIVAAKINTPLSNTGSNKYFPLLRFVLKYKLPFEVRLIFKTKLGSRR